MQRHPQKLLLVFTQSNNLKKEQGSYSSGTINPVMCVDKNPLEIDSFEQLVDEADQIATSWDMLFISTFENLDGSVVTEDQVDSKLKVMVNMILDGTNTAQFIVLDRHQNLINIS